VEVLEHIADWKLALVNVATLLKPEGRLYITARNAAADLRRNDIHSREVTGAQLTDMLLSVFGRVRLYDYTLKHELALDTHVTPLIALATK
jgi:2-polyprenyl-3-methyl-5-hydroxy-6-metoxy-1,4-benzoquinol methylase